MLAKLEREYIFSLKTSLVFGIINDVFNIPGMLVIMIATQLEKKNTNLDNICPCDFQQISNPFYLDSCSSLSVYVHVFFSFLGVAAPFSC